jgi:hypothetical protein
MTLFTALSGIARGVAPPPAHARRSMVFALVLASAGLAATAGWNAPARAQAQDKILNLYSARHYQTDEALYANFTRQTGIKINRIEAGDEALLERPAQRRPQQPGGRGAAGRCRPALKAQIEGLFQPLRFAHPGGTHSGPSAQQGRWQGQRVVRVLDPRAGDPLQQGHHQGGIGQVLSGPRQSGAQGPGLHALGHAPLHAVADRRDVRTPGRSGRRKNGRAAWSQTSPARHAAATPIRSRRWRPGNAVSRSATPTIWRVCCARTSLTTATWCPRSAS